MEFLYRWIRITWIPLHSCVSLEQAGAICAPCRSFNHFMTAECSLGGALAPVVQMLRAFVGSCRASLHTSDWAKGLWFPSLVLDASPMETLVHRDVFVNTLLAEAVLMEKGTDCLAQLVKRASLYLFYSWSSKSKWDHFIPNIVVLEVNRILQKWVRWWVITSATERDKKWCSIQSVDKLEL